MEVQPADAAIMTCHKWLLQPQGGDHTGRHGTPSCWLAAASTSDGCNLDMQPTYKPATRRTPSFRVSTIYRLASSARSPDHHDVVMTQLETPYYLSSWSSSRLLHRRSSPTSTGVTPPRQAASLLSLLNYQHRLYVFGRLPIEFLISRPGMLL